MGNSTKKYAGLDNDVNGAMTDVGRIVRDAQGLGLIDEDETCAGWLIAGIEDLWDRVQQEWRLYDYKVANLPAETQARYLRIQQRALEKARSAGWDPEMGDDD